MTRNQSNRHLTRRDLLRTGAAVAPTLLLGGLLGACSGKTGGDPADGFPPRPEANGEFPDQLPAVPARVESSSYGYDDLKRKYTIELVAPGVFNQPRPDDPIQRYLEKTFNVELKLTAMTGEDLRNKAATTFAAGKPPDLLYLPFGLRDVAGSLWEQGQLVAADDIVPLMPQASSYITQAYKQWASIDEEMIGIPRYPTFPENWGLFVRKDFLDKLGMAKPRTEDDLLAYAKAVTTGDPDGDGKNDSWFMATGGGGNGWGMLGIFQAMYGHPSWNVADGRINHPMIDGTTKRFLEFVRRLNVEKVLPPDWYTTEWEQLKSRSFNDQLGMVNYPGWNLIDETYNASKRDLKKAEVWEPIDPPRSNDGRGGKFPPGGNPDGLFVFPAKTAEDEGKLRRIAHMIDTFIYPNENYWTVSQGGGPEIFADGSKVTFDEKDGTNVFFIDKAKHPAYTQSKYQSLPDWQSFGYTLLWQNYDDPVGNLGSKWNDYVKKLPRYENTGLLLTLDPKTVADIGDFGLENEIQFVLGKRDFGDWDAYVEEWKRAGGQDLLEQAAEQLKVKL
jgi:putative aldouronate transport system substrate-binding protein